MADKRYALIGKMVDLIVEPAMHMSGLDLYDRGANLALTNVMFALLGSGSHDTLLGLFQKMIRTLEFADFEEFAGELFRQQFDDEKMDSFLGYFRAGLLQVGPSILIDPSRTPISRSLLLLPWLACGGAIFHRERVSNSSMMPRQ